MSNERAAERAAYLVAFVEANGKRPVFSLYYERGWWCVRYAYERPLRYRSRQLREMTARLLATAAEQRR